MDNKQKNIMMKACTVGLIKKINHDGLLCNSAYEVFEELSEHVQHNYPEFNQAEIEKCVSYAMQATIKE